MPVRPPMSFKPGGAVESGGRWIAVSRTMAPSRAHGYFIPLTRPSQTSAGKWVRFGFSYLGTLQIVYRQFQDIRYQPP